MANTIDNSRLDEILALLKVRDTSPKLATIDPTLNVLALVAAETKRRDDLSAAETTRRDQLALAETNRVNEIMSLRSAYEAMLREAEAKRIDAIRAVDVAAVAVQNERAVQQAAVLATQVAASKDTLQTLVASTADQVAKTFALTTGQMLDRITELEKSRWQIGGRDTQRTMQQEERAPNRANVVAIVSGILAFLGIAVAVLAVFYK